MKKQYLACGDTPNQWRREPTWRRKRIFLRKRALTCKEEKNIQESIFKNQVLENIGSLEKLHIVQQGKITVCWSCGEVGYYANECKNRKNNKLIETLRSLDYFEISEEEALD